MRIIMAMRRNRASLIMFNYSISLIILIYLLVIGYQSSKIELDYSNERSEAVENGASDDEIKQMKAEQEEEMEPYVYRFKVVASILIPISVFTIFLHNLGPVKPIFAHSELVTIPVAQLVEEP